MYLLFALLLAFIMLVWFQTEAFAEYAERLILWEGYPTLAPFFVNRKQGSPQTFIEYLQLYHDSFFVRLITCPKCLATWLGGITGLIILIPSISSYGFFGGVACAGALPYLTYFAYQLLIKLK